MNNSSLYTKTNKSEGLLFVTQLVLKVMRNRDNLKFQNTAERSVTLIFLGNLTQNNYFVYQNLKP